MIVSRRNAAVTIAMSMAVLFLRESPHAQASADAAGIVVRARSLQPGELVVLTIDTPLSTEAVAVDLFGRRTTAFEIARGKWRALVGIDLDQKPGPYIAAVSERTPAGTSRRTRRVVVRAKQFPTRVLNVSPEFVNPPPEVQQQIAQDSAFLRGVYGDSATERLWSAPFVRPVPDPANSRFGTRSVFNGERRNPHAGADFASPAGRPVGAPNAGRVVAARLLFFSGNTVIIDHGLGMFSMLAHMSEIDVKEGDQVAPGQIVGLVGATGRVTGAHLHWSLNVLGARVDPVSLLTLMGEPAPPAQKRAR